MAKFNKNNVRLTYAELEDLANNLNLDESDVDEDLLVDSDDDDEEFFSADQGVGIVTATHDTIPGDIDLASNTSDSSDEDVPLINYLPKSKKRKWKRTSFEPNIQNFAPTIHMAMLPEAIPGPIDYFTKYLDDSFFESMAMYTNMKEVKKTGKSLDTTAEELKHFFAGCMLIGIYNLPRIRMFWRLDTRVPIISDNISRNRFFLLRTRLKLVDDDAVEGKENDRYWKIRPMINHIQKACRENVRTSDVSIDEQMIAFHGKVRMRQFVRGKPHPVGLKVFVMTTPQGIPLDLHMFEGKGREIESSLVPSLDTLDTGGRVVMKLADTLPTGVSVFVDRYFTSEKLIDAMLARKMYVTGTLMKNRIPKTNIPFKSDKDLKSSGRGSHDMLVTENNTMAIVKWFDSKPIHLASSRFGSEPTGECRRWSVQEKRYVNIERPSIVKHYNEKMGGVDLLDRVIAKYPMNCRTKKWTIRSIFHLMDFSCAAGWLQYKQDFLKANASKSDFLDYLAFKFAIAKSLMFFKQPERDSESESNNSYEEPTAKRRKILPIPDKRVRKKDSKHLPEFTKDSQKSRSKCRNPGCRSLTFTKCSACQVYLCCSVQRNCFSTFHR